MYVGLDTENKKLFGCSNSYEYLCEIAFKEEIMACAIAPLESVFNGLNAFDLAEVYQNITGVKWRGQMVVSTLRDSCLELVKNLKPTGKAPPRSKEEESEATKPEKTITRQDRPKAGTATGRVWDIADSLHSEKYLKEQGQSSTYWKSLRSRVIESCEKEGINPATVQVQFGKWKKSI